MEPTNAGLQHQFLAPAGPETEQETPGASAAPPPFSLQASPADAPPGASGDQTLESESSGGSGAAEPAPSSRMPPPFSLEATGDGPGRMRNNPGEEAATCTTASAWNPSAGTTVNQARETLGDTPCHTLYGAPIGPYSARQHKYMVNYHGIAYSLIAHTGNGRFGIKYAGGSRMTRRMMDELINSSDPQLFTPAQRRFLGSIRPQIQSEGSVSSINTYDNQILTIAGRGELGFRCTAIINAGVELGRRHGMEVPDFSRIRQLVTSLARASTMGTAGNRLNLPEIHELVSLLNQPAYHKIMVLGKLSDSLVTMFGGDFGTRGANPDNYEDDISAEAQAALHDQMENNNLNDATLGIAVHMALGAPTEFPNPASAATRANQRYPQDRAVIAEHGYDFAALSRQVAYMFQVRMANKFDRAGGNATVTTRYFDIFRQKTVDFNNHFREAIPQEAAEETTGRRRGRRRRAPRDTRNFFDMAAATSVISSWISLRGGIRGFDMLGRHDRPSAPNVFLGVKQSPRARNVIGYVNFGPRPS